MRLLFRAGALLALLMVVGCGGDKRASVSGKVTVSGKGPLTGGNIRFISVSDPNRVGGGQIKADGSYEIPDAPLGECKVVIDNTHLDPNAKKTAALPGMAAPGIKAPGPKGAPSGITAPGSAGPKASDKAKMAEVPKGADIPTEMGKSDASAHKFIAIEASYAKPDTTTLRFDVKGGSNTKDFDVK